MSREAQEQVLDREDAILLAKRAAPPRPSSSIVPGRCATCGQWPRFQQTAFGTLCTGDGGPGHPYQPTVTRRLHRMGEQ